MKRALLLAAVLVVMGAGSAEAMTVVGSPLFQRWADKAKVATPETTTTIVEGAQTAGEWPCRYGEGGTAAACVESRANGRMFVSHEFWEAESRATFYHETGHIFDALYLTGADRAWFAGKIGMPAVPWLDPANHRTIGEVFADQYAVCAMRGTRIPYPELVIAEIGDREIGGRLHRKLCRFIGQTFVR